MTGGNFLQDLMLLPYMLLLGLAVVTPIVLLLYWMVGP